MIADICEQLMKLSIIVRRQCIQQAQWAAQFACLHACQQRSQEQIRTPSCAKLEHHIIRSQTAGCDESHHDLRSIHFFAKFAFCVDTDRQSIAINAAASNLVGHQPQTSFQQINKSECKVSILAAMRDEDGKTPMSGGLLFGRVGRCMTALAANWGALCYSDVEEDAPC